MVLEFRFDQCRRAADSVTALLVGGEGTIHHIPLRAERLAATPLNGNALGGQDLALERKHAGGGFVNLARECQ